MLNNRIFNIISIIVILVWIWADRYLKLGSPAYGWILLVYVSVLFCGSYFIRMGFFVESVCSVKTTEKLIALSFDDGPSGRNTETILAVLKKEKAEAAFFCIGKNIAERENQLLEMIAQGHIIGNHTYYHHRFFDLFRSSRMLADMEKMNSAVFDITGFSPRFFRPPYGVTNPLLKKAIVRGGFVSVGWTIRSYDTIIKNEKRLFEKIIRSLKPGAILLLHDSSLATVHILPDLIQAIREKGYEIKRLDKLIGMYPYAGKKTNPYA